MIHWLQIQLESFLFWLVTKLPKRLIYHASIQLLAFITTRGDMASRVVGEITYMEAIEHYGNDYLP